MIAACRAAKLTGHLQDVAERFATRYNGLVFFCTPRPCTSRRAAFAAAILAIVQPAAQQAVDEQCRALPQCLPGFPGERRGVQRRSV